MVFTDVVEKDVNKQLVENGRLELESSNIFSSESISKSIVETSQMVTIVNQVIWVGSEVLKDTGDIAEIRK